MVNNTTIMTKAWLAGTSDFQQRIPNPSIYGIEQTVAALFSPMNSMYLNQFVSTLVNRIGMTIVRQKKWENPLAVFKGSMQYGSSAQEIGVKWIKAHSYSDEEGELLLKTCRPEIEQAFHSLNREDQYCISINRLELKQAFLSEYGLNEFISAVMQVPYNSDAYDEYQIMKNLIGIYDREWGFYRHKLSALPEDEDTAKEFLKAVRTYTGKLKFPSQTYNNSPVDIPTFAKEDELVLFITPEAMASVSVDALASAFNVPYAELQPRIVMLDSLPIDNAVALLTTKDFYFVQDVAYETTEFFNARTLNDNYYLTHFSINSVSPFVPCILFGTFEGTVTPTITMEVTSLEAASTQNEIEPGGTAPITLTLNGTLTANPDTFTTDPIEIAPDAALWEIGITRSDGEEEPTITAVPLNIRTRVDRFGVLHLQKTGVEAGDTVTVTARWTEDRSQTATIEFTVA